MDKSAEEQKRLAEDELKNYKKLDAINSSEEFKTFFDMQTATVVQKMLTVFTGKGPADWEEFCRIRGEVIGILYPIQQVRGAKAIAADIKKHIDTMYNEPV